MNDNQPDISEPKNWALRHLQNERHHLAAAPLAFILIGAGGLVLGWVLTWHIVVPSKNASLETLQISDSAKQSRIAELQSENERLLKQNLDFKAAMAERAMPLKRRTLVLATQLTDFAINCRTNGDQVDTFNQFIGRFENRISKAIADLDENGQQSGTLNKTLSWGMPNLLTNPTNIEVIATELKRLADNLKD